MKQSLNLSRALISACLLLGTVACNGTDTKPDDIEKVGEQSVYRWWENPGDLDVPLATIGMAKIIGDEGFARTRAEADATRKIASTMNTKVQAMITQWSQVAGDYMDEASMSALTNDESFSRQVTDQSISGARVIKYKKHDGQMYVLMMVDDIAPLVANMKQQISAKVIADETFYKTEVRKADASADLDALLAKESADMSAKQNEFKAGIPK
ncbi:MAG: hypothetical protein ACI841_003185 [Planctomycetota bacterium]|jgi:hypothetical protein